MKNKEIKYSVLCKVDGKMFYGKTISTLEDKRNKVIWKSLNPKRNYSKGSLCSYIKNYGPDNFVWKEIEEDF